MAEYTDTLEGGGIEGGNVSASSFLNGSDSDQFPISVPMSPNQGYFSFVPLFTIVLAF